MQAVKRTCSQCGGNGTGPVCGYCGSLLDVIHDIDGERAALDSLHEFVQIVEVSRKAEMLRNGYLPESPDMLIEAGMRLIPLCNSGDSGLEPRDSAMARLETIISRLRILHSDPETERAASHFEQILRKNKRADAFWMVAALLLFVGLPAGGAWWWFTA